MDFMIKGAIYHFPPVRSKSPTTITITKFGQIADSHYFDGNEYNAIPSDQFK